MGRGGGLLQYLAVFLNPGQCHRAAPLHRAARTVWGPVMRLCLDWKLLPQLTAQPA
jgi:hypothetical protein